MKNIWNADFGMFLDEVNVCTFEKIVCGHFGGATKSGATFNEDGYFIIQKNDWRFVVLFDAHASYDSVTLLTDTLRQSSETIENICDLKVEKAVEALQNHILGCLKETPTNEVRGEAAVLFCFEKQGYLWWLSVGDNSLYALHEAFNELGQYRLNQRVFYQWFGQQNAMTLPVPCYSVGTIQLREGLTTVVLLTDGVLEIKGRPFENNAYLAAQFEAENLTGSVKKVLETVQALDGRDSATIIAFNAIQTEAGLRPTRL